MHLPFRSFFLSFC